jgi:hypothetical protein
VLSRDVLACQWAEENVPQAQFRAYYPGSQRWIFFERMPRKTRYMATIVPVLTPGQWRAFDATITVR